MSDEKTMGQAIQIDEARIRDHLGEMVRGTVEETLNAMLDAEADRLCRAGRYERSEDREDTRAGSYERTLHTKAGDVSLKIPKLRRQTFETAIIERYRRRESSVEEALIDMYLAGVSVRRVEDITEALWGTRVSPSTVSKLNKKIYAKIEAWRNRRIDGEHPYLYLIDQTPIETKPRPSAGIFSLAQILRKVSLDTADRQEPSEALKTKTERLKEMIAKLKQEMQRLVGLQAVMLATPDQQISLTDPDALSMATSGRDSGVVGYNVQVAVDTKNHLIVAHEVTNVGTDRLQLSPMAKAAKVALGMEKLDAIADRGYFSGEEILACENAGITVTLPKPMTSNAKAEGRFGKQDFHYLGDEDVYICPVGETLPYRYTTEENGLILHRYWTNACQACLIKQTCTAAKERRITRWEHEHVLEAVQRRLDEHPERMRQRRETVEHPFGTIKARMGANHLLMKTLPRVASERALHVLAYNMTRVMSIMGIRPLKLAMTT